jgi:hypothetical protein
LPHIGRDAVKISSTDGASLRRAGDIRARITRETGEKADECHSFGKD